MYKAIDDILPRDRTEVKTELEKLSSSIENVVDFGTHLLKWQADRRLSGDDVIVPILFLRNILEIGDAISILIKNSSVDPVKPLLRTLMENSFGLEYLLEKDKKNRALAYNVWVAHKDLKFIEKLNVSTQVGKQFSNEIKKDKYVNELKSDKHNLDAGKQNAKELLKLPHYIPIEKEYQRTKKKVKSNPMWYSLFDGPKNIEQLAKKLNYHTSYEINYRMLSDSVHANNNSKNKLFPNADGITTDIIQIRFPKDAQMLTISALNILVMTYSNFYLKELPNKEAEFLEWYSSFRETFRELLEKELFKIKL
ncbi:MAG: hypothetical protein ACJA2M_001252 [Polaribacter sp.]|jgi:hypothetical protein